MQSLPELLQRLNASIRQAISVSQLADELAEERSEHVVAPPAGTAGEADRLVGHIDSLAAATASTTCLAELAAEICAEQFVRLDASLSSEASQAAFGVLGDVVERFVRRKQFSCATFSRWLVRRGISLGLAWQLGTECIGEFAFASFIESFNWREELFVAVLHNAPALCCCHVLAWLEAAYGDEASPELARLFVARVWARLVHEAGPLLDGLARVADGRAAARLIREVVAAPQRAGLSDVCQALGLAGTGAAVAEESFVVALGSTLARSWRLCRPAVEFVLRRDLVDWRRLSVMLNVAGPLESDVQSFALRQASLIVRETLDAQDEVDVVRLLTGLLFARLAHAGEPASTAASWIGQHVFGHAAMASRRVYLAVLGALGTLVPYETSPQLVHSMATLLSRSEPAASVGDVREARTDYARLLRTRFGDMPSLAAGLQEPSSRAPLEGGDDSARAGTGTGEDDAVRLYVSEFERRKGEVPEALRHEIHWRKAQFFARTLPSLMTPWTGPQARAVRRGQRQLLGRLVELKMIAADCVAVFDGRVLEALLSVHGAPLARVRQLAAFVGRDGAAGAAASAGEFEPGVILSRVLGLLGDAIEAFEPSESSPAGARELALELFGCWRALLGGALLDLNSADCVSVLGPFCELCQSKAPVSEAWLELLAEFVSRGSTGDASVELALALGMALANTRALVSPPARWLPELRALGAVQEGRFEPCTCLFLELVFSHAPLDCVSNIAWFVHLAGAFVRASALGGEAAACKWRVVSSTSGGASGSPPSPPSSSRKRTHGDAPMPAARKQRCSCRALGLDGLVAEPSSVHMPLALIQRLSWLSERASVTRRSSACAGFAGELFALVGEVALCADAPSLDDWLQLELGVDAAHDFEPSGPARLDMLRHGLASRTEPDAGGSAAHRLRLLFAGLCRVGERSPVVGIHADMLLLLQELACDAVFGASGEAAVREPLWRVLLSDRGSAVSGARLSVLGVLSPSLMGRSVALAASEAAELGSVETLVEQLARVFTLEREQLAHRHEWVRVLQLVLAGLAAERCDALLSRFGVLSLAFVMHRSLDLPGGSGSWRDDVAAVRGLVWLLGDGVDGAAGAATDEEDSLGLGYLTSELRRELVVYALLFASPAKPGARLAAACARDGLLGESTSRICIQVLLLHLSDVRATTREPFFGACVSRALVNLATASSEAASRAHAILVRLAGVCPGSVLAGATHSAVGAIAFFDLSETRGLACVLCMHLFGLLHDRLSADLATMTGAQRGAVLAWLLDSYLATKQTTGLYASWRAQVEALALRLMRFGAGVSAELADRMLVHDIGLAETLGLI